MPKRIELKGEVGREITARSLKNKLPKDGTNAIIVVDSYGGSVFEGNRLFNTIKDHLEEFPNSLKVEFGVVGASAASYFPLAVGVENISVRENTVFMIHKAWNFAIGNSDEMLLVANILDGFDRMIAKIYSEITGKTIDDTLNDMKDEVWLMGGQAVLDAGFATSIVEASQDENETENNLLNKNEISAKIEEIKNKLKDVDNKEDLNKWVAKLVDTPNNNESNPPLGDGNIEKEDISDMAKMTLEEYLNSNPEAKAENDLVIKAAVDDGVKNERARGLEILNLASGNISENVLNAYKEGMTAGEYAVNEINANKKTREDAKPQNLGDINPGNQVPTGENSLVAQAKVDEDDVNKFLEGDK